MKPTASRRSHTATHDPDQLLELARGLGEASCRLEDAAWEEALTALIDQLLAEGGESVLTAALETLYNQRERAYEALIELIELRCETCSTQTNTAATRNAPRQHLLLAAPLLAWSRFSIPVARLPEDVLSQLHAQLLEIVLAPDVTLVLADHLYSPDQLPQSYSETAQLTQQLARQAGHASVLHIAADQLAETASFLSDTRYLLGMASVTPGAPLFRWQTALLEGTASTLAQAKQQVLERWQERARKVLQPLLTACASELLLPQSYHAACRMADRNSRPYSLHASVAFLTSTLNLKSGDLRAIVAPFFAEQLEEYRIGFTLRNDDQVIHGVVWALLDAEDESSELPGQIEACLRDLGIAEILYLDHRLPVEYCDDCGTPLYPNPDGVPVHAEIPEEQIDNLPRHLH